MAKKIGVFMLCLFSVLLTLSLVSAVLEVKQTPISVVAVPELQKPAIFQLNIKNLGNSDTLSIYSFASVNLEPNESVFIANNEEKEIYLKVYPTFPLKISPDYYSFEYKITGANLGTQLEELALTLLAPKDVFDIVLDDVTPDSKNAVVHFKNKYGGTIEGISAEVTSPLFSSTRDFTVNAFEDKQVEVPIYADKAKSLLAWQYVVYVKFNIQGVVASKKSVINFNEKAGIETSESLEGKILRRYEIEKKNNGNVKSEVTISISKNLFASLFTSFNLRPSKKELEGFHINYLFRKELSPNESLRVIAKTNWWILVGIIVLLVVIYYLIDKYISNKLVINKSVSFVRTKGGEFALKVTIKAKARDFVERIRIMDRLPPMLKVFERYGIEAPEKIDERNRRLEWNISALSDGEERIVSYIVYSKIGVMGKFELPSAEAIYEYQGKIKEAQSNRAFYLNEQR